MTEKEELEKGVAESKANQIVQSVNEYLDRLAEKLHDELVFSSRADLGFMVTIVAQMSLNLLMFTLDTPDDMAIICRAIVQLIVIFAIARSWLASRAWSNTHSEFAGALHTLKLLGMIPPRDAERRRQKQPLWEKGIALVESWAKAKKEVKTGFAPA